MRDNMRDDVGSPEDQQFRPQSRSTDVRNRLTLQHQNIQGMSFSPDAPRVGGGGGAPDPAEEARKRMEEELRREQAGFERPNGSRSIRYDRTSQAPDNFFTTLTDNAPVLDQISDGYAEVVVTKDRTRSIEITTDPETLKRLESEASVEIAKDYRATVLAGETLALEVLDKLARFEAPYPYNARPEAAFFEGARQDLTYILDLDKIPDSQKGLVYRMRADQEQQEAVIKAMFATGGATESYYDVLRHLQTLISASEYNMVAPDLVSWLQKDDPGLTNVDEGSGKLNIVEPEPPQEPVQKGDDDPARRKFQEEQREYLVRQKMYEKQKKEYVKNKEAVEIANEGIRKEVIRKQDDGRMWSMAVAAVAQFDPEEEKGNETFMSTVPEEVQIYDGKEHQVETRVALSEKKQKLVKLLFGYKNKDDVTIEEGAVLLNPVSEDNWTVYSNKRQEEYRSPQLINNWYSVGDEDHLRKDYEAKMIELINVKYDDGAGVWDHIDDFSETQLQTLVDTIRGQAREKIKKWKDPYKDPNTRIAARTSKTWIETDKGFMSVGHMSWHWELPEGTANEATRSWDQGGIYKAHDVGNGRNWVLKKMQYDAGLKLGEDWTMGTHHGIRKRWLTNKPGWSPPMNEIIDTRPETPKGLQRKEETKTLRYDENMQQIWDFWFSPEWRDERLYKLAGKGGDTSKVNPDLDSDIRKWLMEDCRPWYWETWAEDSKNPGEFLSMPMFFPAEIDELNLWDYLGKKEGESVWHKWSRGVKPSEITYGKLNNQFLNRHWVSMNFLARTVSKLIDPANPERDRTIAMNAGSGSDAKYEAKDITMSFRDMPTKKEMEDMLEDGNAYKYLVSLLPYVIVQNLVNKHGVMSPTFALSQDEATAYYADVTRWVQTLQDLPANVMGDIKDTKYKNFGNDLAIMVLGYADRAYYISQNVTIANREKEMQKMDAQSEMFGRKTGTKLDNVFLKKVAGQAAPTKLDSVPFDQPKEFRE